MSDLKIEHSKYIIHLRLNRPEKMNAFNPEMIKGITHFFNSVSKSKAARIVMLSGAGPSFCAGADLKWMRSMAKFTRQENEHDAKQLYEMFEAAENCPLPILGKIHGNVFGGGLGLVSICDIAVAEMSSQFCFSEARLGLVPAVISAFVIKKMQYNRAKEMMITAKMFGAQAAQEAGLIEYVGRELEIEKYLHETINAILNCGPDAIAEIKSLMKYVSTHSQPQNKSESIKTIARVRVSEEGQEGIASFLEKRKARWVRIKANAKKNK